MNSEYFETNAGLDLISPPMRKAPGALTIANNVEVTQEATERMVGYERVDGQASPSDALYAILDFDAGQAEIEVGDTIDGDTSGAQAIVLAVVVESGAWTGDAAGYLVIGEVTGTFADDEDISVSATVSATADGSQAIGSANTPELDAEYFGLAYEYRRDQIGPPPGSGPTRWAAYLEDVLYCARDDAGATEQVVYRATSSGWQAVDLGIVLQYDTGSRTGGPPPRTTLVTGGTSGAVGNIAWLNSYTGSWDPTGNAAGVMQLYNVTGTFTNGEALTVGSGTATVAAPQTAQTRLPGGKGRVIDHNFFATDDLECLIVTDEVNKAALVFGDRYVEIDSTMVPDSPKAAAAWDERLWLLFEGGSVQRSVAAEPATFNPILGAGAIGLGEEGNDMIIHQGGYMVVMGNTRIMTVASNGDGTYTTRPYNQEMGGKPRTAARVVGSVLFLDQVGIVSMSASDVVGAFESASISRAVKPIADSFFNRDLWAHTYRKGNQYRIVDDAGNVLIASYRDNALQGFTTCRYEFLPKCAATTTGRVVYGSSTGMVYELKGNSLDGEDIESYGKFAFSHSKSPTTLKSYMFITPELETTKAYTISVSVEFGYGSDEYAPSSGTDINRNTSGGIWDISRWDSAYWSEATVSSTPIADFQGVAENFAIYFRAVGKHAPPWKWSGVLASYEPLRMKM